MGRYTDEDERNDNSGRTWPPAPDAVEAAEQVGTKAEGRSAPISQPTTTGGEPVILDRVFIGETAYVRADEAVRQIMALQAKLYATPPNPLTGEVLRAAILSHEVGIMRTALEIIAAGKPDPVKVATDALNTPPLSKGDPDVPA